MTKDPNIAVPCRTASAKRPMAKVHRVALFARTVMERVSNTGVDLLLAKTTKLTEGELSREGHFYGTCMFTLDMGKLTDYLQDPCDPATASRLAGHLAGDAKVLERVSVVARREACRIAGIPLPRLETEVRVRAEGSWIFIDVDVEADAQTIGKSKRAS